MKFVHLNLHTEFSICDGIVRIDELIKTCKQQNIQTIAITDQSNLFALVKFYRETTKAGIKPIIGVDIWLENSEDSKHPFKLLLLARNQVGYQNIFKIISLSYTKGQYLGKPIVKKAWMQELSDGLIVLSGAEYGDVGQALLANNLNLARELAGFWQNLFPNSYYLELQRVGAKNEADYIQKAVDLAVELQCPVVATNPVRFLVPEDFEAHEARVCINSGHVLNDPARPHLYTEYQYLRTSADMEVLFNDIPEALINSVEIAKRCNIELILGKTFLPIFPTPENTTPEIYMVEQTKLGLIKRGVDTSLEIYNKRLDYEIDVINKMGFASYFLIVADFIAWAKNNGVPVGPGRGSGAGSLIAYTLGITDIDPIEHELLFERFLNPERVSLPDFDIDFCVEGRDRVIEYVANRYGKDKVAQIITYGTMAARAVVRDVGRTLGYAYGFVDKIAKLIPFEVGISLERAIKEEELLQQKYNQEDEVKTLIDLAMKLEGITRNAGKHAGGVVVAPSALTDFMPLYCEDGGEGIVTQLDKNDVEKIGLVKFDFLGLRTLTIINMAVNNINSRLDAKIVTTHQVLSPRGEARGTTVLPKIDISTIPLDDPATYKLLQSCNTTAIFQLESRISRDVIKKFKPDCFADITALVAIIRPGVLQSGLLDEFFERKHGRLGMAYLHPKLEPILKPTYGVAIYQEQVMQVAQSLAGYSLGGADLLRRAMGKKDAQEMALQRTIFLDGAAKNDISANLANTIFDYMEKFASYGFNKSHSAAYALIAYQTAWLKAHYPAEFMAAVLSSDMDNTDKVVIFLQDCKLLKLKIIAPDINTSNYQFTVKLRENLEVAGKVRGGEPVIKQPQGDELLYGLGAVKGVGQAAIESILEARTQGGNFKSLFDLCQRVDGRKVNKRSLEALIYSGALDNIGPNRASLIASMAVAMKSAEQQGKQRASGQVDLFGGLDAEYNNLPDYVIAEDFTEEGRLQHEKAVLGFYLNGHPIEQFNAELSQFISKSIAGLTPEAGKNILIAGFIQKLKIVNTKSGNRLAIVTLEDASASIDVTMYAENFTEAREYLVEGQLVIVEGEVGVDTFSDGYRIRATKAMSLEQARLVYARGLILKLSAEQISADSLENLYKILQDYTKNIDNKCQIFIAYSNTQAQTKLRLSDKWKVPPKEELLIKLRSAFGSDNVIIIYK